MDGAISAPTDTPSISDTPRPASPPSPPFLPTLTLSLSELERQITELAGHLNAANYRWLCLIEEFDRRGGWSDGALHSCAHWLNFKCGLNLGAAREKVRVAHALVKLPKIAAAMEQGKVSYSKVRALTRVAVEATEDFLLTIALHGTAHHVERLVRYYRRAKEVEELAREARQHENRRFSYWYDSDGGLVFKGYLPALGGAALIKALETAVQALPPVHIEARSSASPANFPTRRADALALIAEQFLERGAQELSTADRYQVVVHVDEQTLRENAPGRCEVEQGPSLPAETVRRIACDASLIRITENEQGEVLDVGRKTRTLPAALRRALSTRDEGCRFPGCTHRTYVDAHHIRHWAHGGQTKLTNLVTLCRFHHRYVHEQHVSFEPQANGAWRFVRANGIAFTELPEAAGTHDWRKLIARHEETGIRIDHKTAATRWQGERMDYSVAIEALWRQEQRAAALGGGHSADEKRQRGDEDPGFERDVAAETLHERDSEHKPRPPRTSCPPGGGP